MQVEGGEEVGEGGGVLAGDGPEEAEDDLGRGLEAGLAGEAGQSQQRQRRARVGAGRGVVEQVLLAGRDVADRACLLYTSDAADE